ncbi:hypothetical protein AB0N62_41920 [Streptomyces sp. NPDC093982]|uniref:hypothetical protein n=1 Tax=Streptomyces sp. NPDC093982 TaxID=3155077 RepID=UPI00342698B2
MTVTWAATALESGEYSAVERDSDVEELADHFNQLRSRDQGYIEVRLPVSEFLDHGICCGATVSDEQGRPTGVPGEPGDWCEL